MGYMMSFSWGMPAFMGWFIWPLLLWSLIWKGLALWKAARSNSVPWFVALLIINTAGILEILYIYVLSDKKVMDKIMHETKTN